VNLSVLQTLITYDAGATWQRLAKPTVDSEGKPVVCPPGEACHLNLLGAVDRHADEEAWWAGYGRYYSVPSAVGIMLATGNVGEGLKLNSDDDLYVYRCDFEWLFRLMLLFAIDSLIHS